MKLPMIACVIIPGGCSVKLYMNIFEVTDMMAKEAFDALEI